MKKVISIVLCMVLILSLAGCKEKDKNGIKYDTIQNIYKNTAAQQVLPFNKDKTPIPVRVPNASEVYSLTLEKIDYVPFLETFVKFYSDTFDPTIAEVTDPESNLHSYETDEFALTAGVGGLTYYPKYNGERNEHMSAETDAERISITRLYRGEAMSEESLPLSDGNLSMKQAGEQVNAFLTEKMSVIEPNYTHNIRTVFTRKFDDNTYAYEFYVERLYKGVHIDSTKSYPSERKFTAPNNNRVRIGMQFTITVFSVGGYKTWYLTPHGFNFDVTSEKKLENKFITFDSAVKILNDNVSGVASFTINSAEFCYDISYPAVYVQKEGELHERCLNEAVTKEFTSNPMWVFVIDHENDFGQENGHDIHTSYMVDAVTGKVSVYPSRAVY